MKNLTVEHLKKCHCSMILIIKSQRIQMENHGKKPMMKEIIHY